MTSPKEQPNTIIAKNKTREFLETINHGEQLSVIREEYEKEIYRLNLELLKQLSDSAHALSEMQTGYQNTIELLKRQIVRQT